MERIYKKEQLLGLEVEIEAAVFAEDFLLLCETIEKVFMDKIVSGLGATELSRLSSSQMESVMTEIASARAERNNYRSLIKSRLERLPKSVRQADILDFVSTMKDSENQRKLVSYLFEIL